MATFIGPFHSGTASSPRLTLTQHSARHCVSRREEKHVPPARVLRAGSSFLILSFLSFISLRRQLRGGEERRERAASPRLTMNELVGRLLRPGEGQVCSHRPARDSASWKDACGALLIAAASSCSPALLTAARPPFQALSFSFHEVKFQSVSLFKKWRAC